MTAIKTPLPLLRILAIEAVSSFVHQSLALAVPWYVIRTTGSALWTAAVAFAIILPYIFGSTSGGMLAEKYGSTRTIMVSETLQVLMLICVSYIMLNGEPVIILCAAMFVSAFLDAQSKVSRTALLPVYSRLAGRNLHSVNGIREAIIGASAVLGPLAAGFLIALDNESYAVNAFILLYLVVFSLALQAYQKREYSRVEKRNVNVGKSWTYIKRRKTLLRGILFSLPMFIVSFSWESVILPSYVKLAGAGTVFLGALSASFGIGVLAGALFYAAYGRNFKFKPVLLINYLGSVVSLYILFFVNRPLLILSVSALCGIPFGMFNAAAVTFVVAHTKEIFRTVTVGIFASMCAAVECLSVVGIGVLIDSKGFFFSAKTLIVLFFIIVLLATAFYKDRKIVSLIK